MYKITSHPILPVPEENTVTFMFNGKPVAGQRGNTIAAALHRAGYVVHNHSSTGRNRTLQCGIGKCGACEMLVDGKTARICITKVDDVRSVQSGSKSPDEYKIAGKEKVAVDHKRVTYQTEVAIIGAGPAGLSVREELKKGGIDNLVIDNNSTIGGQFNMQTHSFFFFEKEHRFGGLRGFEIAKSLAGEDRNGILLDCVVWDILDHRKLAVKNKVSGEIFYVLARRLVVATGAVPFMPPFKNDDVPGVYTAAVIQRMMNCEFTLLGKNILTIGAGNIGYLTSYQAMQAGAHIKAIVEAAPKEGGFPVQANRIKRLGIPVITSHLLQEAIPNKDYTGITGAIITRCENFKPVPGTEQVITGIDCINICTGLTSDNQLFIKGKEVFGRDCYAVGDALRIGEGTSAVLKGKECAWQIMEALSAKFNYEQSLETSREYLDSLQHPVKVLDKPMVPSPERAAAKPFVVANCLYGFACNPCTFACRHGAIRKVSTSSVPEIDYNKCQGCMECISQCPGLAIFGYNTVRSEIFLPVEYPVTEKAEVFLVDDNGVPLGNGIIHKIGYKTNKTHVARIKITACSRQDISDIKGFIPRTNYPAGLDIKPVSTPDTRTGIYICHCEDITEEALVKQIGTRKSITADELKHITRIGMGPCRGKRCLARARQTLRKYGIEVTGEFTPRAPMANLVNMGEMTTAGETFIIHNHSPKKVKTGALVAGGGIAGSALFRYLAEAGYGPHLINYQAGSSWRNIAGGRPAFSKPEIADMARHNLEIFKALSNKANIDFHLINYINFVHDEQSYAELDASRAWSDAYMVEKKDFRKEISGWFNPTLQTYTHALVSRNCWQASPGKTVNALRNLAVDRGGTLLENAELMDIQKNGKEYEALVKIHGNKEEYVLFRTPVFINALGSNAGDFARKLGYDTGHYPVKHQAFITKRLPLLGKNGTCLDMLIDRRNYKGFSAIYGQQLTETGQIIGCASPAVESREVSQNLKINTSDFLETAAEVFTSWLPLLKEVGFQATWSGYYTEPRYMIDPERGLFMGMRGHGFMLSQYIARLYVDYLQGKPVPEYFKTMKYGGTWRGEQAFK